MVTRRQLLQGAGALALSSLLPKSEAALAKPLRFVHLTDLHIYDQLGAPEAVAKCVQAVLALRPRPEFVLIGGDHIMDGLKATRDGAEAQFKLLAEAMRPLEMPIYHTIGNHDIFGWENAAGSSADPGYGKALFEEEVKQSRSYEAFGLGGWRFIILDTIQPKAGGWYAAVDQEQLAWLEKELEAHPGAPTVVSAHVPLFTIFSQHESSSMAPSPNTLVTSNGRDVFQILKKYNVKLVLQGHTHIVEECDYLGTRFITAGSVCGEWWKGPRLGVHPEGFSVIDLAEGQAKWTYHPYGWKSPYKLA